MQLDIPHIIVTAIILYSVVSGMQHISPFSEMSKGKWNGIQFVLLFSQHHLAIRLGYLSKEMQWVSY